MQNQSNSLNNKMIKFATVSGVLFVLIALFLSLFILFNPYALQAGEIEEPPQTSYITDIILDPTPPMQQALTRELQVKVEVSNLGSGLSRNISLEIPLIAALDSPYQALLDERFSHEPAALNLQALGSRTMTVELPSLGPGESEVIILDYALASTVGNDGASLMESSTLKDFLRPSHKVESDHTAIRAEAAQITRDARSCGEKVKQIYAFVVDHLSYNESSAYRNEGALSALRHKEGVCEDYAALFTALCRAAGVPARVVYGYTDPTGTGDIFRLAPGEVRSLRGYRHAWVEFYLEGEGWCPADPTFENGSGTFRYFGSLPHGDRIAQNYLDLSITGRYRGGQLAINWDELLVAN